MFKFKQFLIVNITIKVFKRGIKTEKLQNLMEKIMQNPTLQKAQKTVNNEEFIAKLQQLKEHIDLKVDKKSYETIQENLKASKDILKELREKANIMKEKSMKLDIEINQELKDFQNIKLDTLNNNLKNVRELNTNNNEILNQDNNLLDHIEKYNDSASNIRKSIFDISWLQSYFDFMHSHSTLVLTIGGGLIMGGMWYMNNIGFINIGSLLSRLGIQIFSRSGFGENNNTRVLQQPIEITNPIIENTTERSIGQGFFRELGKKVLHLLDIFIEKLESKRQKYK